MTSWAYFRRDGDCLANRKNMKTGLSRGGVSYAPERRSAIWPVYRLAEDTVKASPGQVR